MFFHLYFIIHIPIGFEADGGINDERPVGMGFESKDVHSSVPSFVIRAADFVLAVETLISHQLSDLMLDSVVAVIASLFAKLAEAEDVRGDFSGLGLAVATPTAAVLTLLVDSRDSDEVRVVDAEREREALQSVIVLYLVCQHCFICYLASSPGD